MSITKKFAEKLQPYLNELRSMISKYEREPPIFHDRKNVVEAIYSLHIKVWYIKKSFEEDKLNGYANVIWEFEDDIMYFEYEVDEMKFFYKREKAENCWINALKKANACLNEVANYLENSEKVEKDQNVIKRNAEEEFEEIVKKFKKDEIEETTRELQEIVKRAYVLGTIIELNCKKWVQSLSEQLKIIIFYPTFQTLKEFEKTLDEFVTFSDKLPPLGGEDIIRRAYITMRVAGKIRDVIERKYDERIINSFYPMIRQLRKDLQKFLEIHIIGEVFYPRDDEFLIHVIELTDRYKEKWKV